jgi:hypothetical protein
MPFHEDWHEFVIGLPEKRPDAHPIKTIGWFFGRYADYVEASGWFRFLRMLEVLAIIVALIAFTLDYQIRQEERASRAEERLARMWGLATDPRPGNSGKIPALEYLNKQGKPLAGISIPEAYLNEINLSNARLGEADLSGAKLNEANLSGTYLYKTDLTGASLILATLSDDTYLVETNLSGANLSGAMGLTQPVLDMACADPGNPPFNLPRDENEEKLVWHGGACPEE